ncbi:hypothetical protein G9A89_012217 [Geosiphon pyriformis]|nr:hypothetical protein G9A89_012217 [Geosiphon pyriformis]
MKAEKKRVNRQKTEAEMNRDQNSSPLPSVNPILKDVVNEAQKSKVVTPSDKATTFLSKGSVRERLHQIQEKMIAKSRAKSHGMKGKAVKTIPKEWWNTVDAEWIVSNAKKWQRDYTPDAPKKTCKESEKSSLRQRNEIFAKSSGSHRPLCQYPRHSLSKYERHSIQRTQDTTQRPGVGGKTIATVEKALLGDRRFLCYGCGKAYKAKNGLTYHQTRCKMLNRTLTKGKFARKPLQRDDLVDCLCGTEDDGGEMVQCDHCRGWLHLDCIRLTSDELPDDYYCPRCVWSYDSNIKSKHDSNTRKEKVKEKEVERQQNKLGKGKHKNQVDVPVKREKYKDNFIYTKQNYKNIESQNYTAPIIHPGNLLNKIEKNVGIQPLENDLISEPRDMLPTNIEFGHRDYFRAAKFDTTDEEGTVTQSSGDELSGGDYEEIEEKCSENEDLNSLNSDQSDNESTLDEDDAEFSYQLIDNLMEYTISDYQAYDPQNLNLTQEDEASNHWEVPLYKLGSSWDDDDEESEEEDEQVDQTNTDKNYNTPHPKIATPLLPRLHLDSKCRYEGFEELKSAEHFTLRRGNSDVRAKVDSWVNDNRIYHEDVMMPDSTQDSMGFLWDPRISIPNVTFCLNDDLCSPLDSQPPSLVFDDENGSSPTCSASSATTTPGADSNPAAFLSQYIDFDGLFEETTKMNNILIPCGDSEIATKMDWAVANPKCENLVDHSNQNWEADDGMMEFLNVDD